MALPKAEIEKLSRHFASPASPNVSHKLHLEAGDNLTRAEFERLYSQTSDKFKAELIEGVVYVPSPVRHRPHGKPHRRIVTWVGNYCDDTPGTDSSDNATLRLGGASEPQPDVMLFIEAEAGGNVRITEDEYLEGSPELVVEVAASSASYDLHQKLRAYQRNGVKEYIVWRSEENELDWFRLRKNQYVKASPDANGVIRSRVFPGLHLNVPALLAGDMKKVQAELRRGLSSKTHAAFVKKLAAAASKKAEKKR